MGYKEVQDEYQTMNYEIHEDGEGNVFVKNLSMVSLSVYQSESQSDSNAWTTRKSMIYLVILSADQSQQLHCQSPKLPVKYI